MTNNYPKKAALAALGLLLATAAPVAAQVSQPTTEQAAKSKISADLLRVAATSANLRSATTTGEDEDSSFSAGSDIQIYNGYVVIEAVARTGNAAELLADLQAKGLRNGAAYGALVSGLLPLETVPALEGVASLQHVRPAYAPITNVGRVTSQGDSSLRAGFARRKYGVTGAGVKVGVLSDSYDNLKGAAAGVTSGDLPAGVEVLSDMPSGGSDEGRAMAEIVHDVAPGSKIAFYTAFLGQPAFAQGIEALQAAGCQVIVDDVFYFAEPFFQNGVVAQAAEKVVKNGSTYFSAAGNFAQQSYQAGFKNSGLRFPGVAGVAHDFGGGDILQEITIPARGTLRLALQWDDPFFSASGVNGAQTDLDMYLVFNGRLLPFFSRNANIGGDPFEFVNIVSNSNVPLTVSLLIVKAAGPDPSVIKYLNFGSAPVAVQYDTKSSTLVGHANAENAIAVGAAAYAFTPAYSATRFDVEGFSALGGTPILFNDLGERLAGPRVFNKPEITGPDGANNTFFPARPNADADRDGFPNFFGTSASSPHVAAVAALMVETASVYHKHSDKKDKHDKKNYGDITPAEIRDYLQSTALDMNSPLTPEFDQGFDFKTGYGFVQADAVLARIIENTKVHPQVLNDLENVLNLQLYPNPSASAVTFVLDAAKKNDQISLVLLDRMGVEVFRTTATGRLELTQDFSKLPKGIYLAKVEVEGQISTQRLVLQ
ncbi:S8 family serine peptidase [Hymenobacter weizhouensis]|uniref:S8 family serine peptidase n=1 Tax=Hymenobacter sp. YIM 151500-1 TaxID=2987689 RepID=UPI00222794D7|nr:S8 family serine peptidase [Hymenobacter sp. YIM 151500-1]UYZ61512.1 T9SS type A sorting domain-containing protein [Hymenobacter sp. YIM 151500-1]